MRTAWRRRVLGGGGARGLPWCLAALLASCSPPRPMHLPVVAPEHTPTPSRRLLAGFGRADITPPPGLGLAGNGAEGRRARGYRTRLYARALVLEDKAGERLAIVATDLGFTSAQVQRKAVWLVNQRYPGWLSTDRLIVTATHTHSGPGSFLDAMAFNALASSVGGYDQTFTDMLVRAVARALCNAIANRRPAAIAWGTTRLWGFTRNRSVEAYGRDPYDSVPQFDPPSDLADSLRDVDPTWLMLRVDTVDTQATHLPLPHWPVGAFSVFAMHGTTNAEVDSFYDGDIQALLERSLERHIDTLNRDTDAAGSLRPVSRAVHLLANGTEGDVSPVWPAESRCPPPVLVPIGWRPGPRAPHPAPEWLETRRARVAECIASGREAAAAIAASMNPRIAALFDRLDGSVRDTATIGVAFDALSLQGGLAPPSLCEPAVGVSALAGAPDGRTRLMGWRLLGFLGSTITDERVAAREEPVGCQGTKRELYWWLQWTLGKLGAIPDFAQFTVARVGNVVLATAPAEITTVAGEQIRRAVLNGLGDMRTWIRPVAVVSLANGHLQYVATDAEFARQRFEGGFTLYGPGTAGVFADFLGRLARRLTPDGLRRSYRIPDLQVTPGPSTRILPLPRNRSGPRFERKIVDAACAAGVVRVEWIDQRPETVLPHEGPLVRFEELVGAAPAGTWKLITWDDDPAIEVLPLHPDGDGYLWRLRWAPHPAPAGSLRVVLEPRAGETHPITRSLPDNCFAQGGGH